MLLPICGDPDCPNKSRVGELEAENRRLREQLHDLQVRELRDRDHIQEAAEAERLRKFGGWRGEEVGG